MTPSFFIRKAQMPDVQPIFHLYQTVSRKIGGLARVESEITLDYVENFTQKSIEKGLQFLILDQNKIVGEIHAYRLEPAVFRHVFSELTVAVDPHYQGQGLGKQLFQAFLQEVSTYETIARVELIVRESNQKALDFYQKLGFRIEGKLENRIYSQNGLEADIPMAWFNPNFKK